MTQLHVAVQALTHPLPALRAPVSQGCVSLCPVFSSPHYCHPLWYLPIDSQFPYLLILQSLVPRVQAAALQRCSKPCSGTRRQVTLRSKKSPRDVTGGVRGPAPSLAMLQLTPTHALSNHQSAHTRLFLTPGPLPRTSWDPPGWAHLGIPSEPSVPLV